MIFTVSVQILEDQYLVVALIAGFVAGVIFIVYRLSCRLLRSAWSQFSEVLFEVCEFVLVGGSVYSCHTCCFVVSCFFLYFSTVDVFPTLFRLACWENT